MKDLNSIEKMDKTRFTLFDTGFRPMFLAASFYAVVSMIFWMFVYNFRPGFEMHGLVPMSWHAHEMIYGYSLAVIAGFLLTAVKNWTGIKTMDGIPLMVLTGFWVAARVFSFTGDLYYMSIGGVFDILFWLILIYAVTRPVIKAKDRRQKGIILLLSLLLIGNLVYYLGVIYSNRELVVVGIYGGVYVIVAMIMIMARRVVPFFTERGVDYSVSLNNYEWIDRYSISLFAVYAFLEVFIGQDGLSATLALALFITQLIRLSGWYTSGIWKKPLLWILFAAYFLIIVGFGLRAVSLFFPVNPYLFLHAYTAGGIGVMTVGMMARVSLGHTGRSVNDIPEILKWIFFILIMSVIIRVMMPVIFPTSYTLWIMVSQVLWILSFAIFIYQYTPFLIYPRADGKPG